MTRRKSKPDDDHGSVIRPLDGEEDDVRQRETDVVLEQLVASIRPLVTEGIQGVLRPKRQRKPAEPVGGLYTPFGSEEGEYEVRPPAAREDDDDGMGSVMGGGF